MCVALGENELANFPSGSPITALNFERHTNCRHCRQPKRNSMSNTTTVSWKKKKKRTEVEKNVTRHIFPLHKMRYFATCSFGFFIFLLVLLFKMVFLHSYLRNEKRSETKMSTRYDKLQHGLQVFLYLSRFFILPGSAERVRFIKCHQMFCELFGVRFVYQHEAGLLLFLFYVFRSPNSIFVCWWWLRWWWCYLAPFFMLLFRSGLVAVDGALRHATLVFFYHKRNLIKWIQFENLIVSSVIIHQLYACGDIQ